MQTHAHLCVRKWGIYNSANVCAYKFRWEDGSAHAELNETTNAKEMHDDARLFDKGEREREREWKIQRIQFLQLSDEIQLSDDLLILINTTY